jgi:hypothetical protein
MISCSENPRKGFSWSFGTASPRDMPPHLQGHTSFIILPSLTLSTGRKQDNDWNLNNSTDVHVPYLMVPHTFFSAKSFASPLSWWVWQQALLLYQRIWSPAIPSCKLQKEGNQQSTKRERERERERESPLLAHNQPSTWAWYLPIFIFDSIKSATICKNYSMRYHWLTTSKIIGYIIRFIKKRSRNSLSHPCFRLYP